MATPATVTKANPLVQLADYGQSVWLDFIRRSIITTGELHHMLQEDGLRGVTSNPAIFEKAIAGSTDYSTAFEALQGREDLDAMGLYEELAIRDIQDAADVLRPIYDRSNKRDGYVSLEVSPYLARKTQESIAEARRLWKAVARPNVMIKIPGTPEGLPAIEQAISEGINVNVTLLFSMEAYEKVAEAYIKGLEKFVAGGGDPSKVASVASFFISRIDSLVDQIAEGKLKTSKNPGERALLRSVMGKVAIANAKITYQRYKEIYGNARWKALAAKGAQTQRLLWASTSTKNPNYRHAIYVEELIGPDTVDTIPPATFDAFRDHGKCRPSLEANLEDAHDTMGTLEQVGISFTAVTDQLLDEGIKIFNEAFDKLLTVVEKKRRVSKASIVARQTYKLPEAAVGHLKAAVQDWRNNSKVRRLWARDASLWTNTDESSWLGWLGVTEEQLGNVTHLTSIGDEVKREGFQYCLLLGMGGSSLCPEVMKITFGKIAGYPELHILDSTDPAQVKAFEKKIDFAKTIFIVSSKSGTTLEPNIFKQYFFEKAKEVLGPQKAPQHFIAITDPRSKMERVAGCDGFRHIFFGLSSIGGRFSALSDFGMVPSAVMGLDPKKLLEKADEMVHACSSSVPVEENPGVMLGLIMGTLANQGRDKVTIITSPGIWDLGAWLEQLLAESSGKEGKGVIPVDQEKLGPPAAYGNDRLFCYLRLDNGADAAQDAAIDALEKAGHPVVRIAVADPYDITMEFFRWEIAIAVAGSVMGINAFNQPDVEASKVATRKLTNEYEKTGSLPAEAPILEADSVKLYTDEANAKAIAQAAGNDKSLAGYLKAHLGRIKAGDYFGLLGYIEMNDAHNEVLQGLRHSVRDKRKVATCLGFGPRFLHSTGQAYKGGPNSGVFLQITCDDANDLPVPGQKYTFGVVKAAQARGDFAVLAERGRRALRVHLGKDVKAGLDALRKAFEKAL